MKDEPVARIYPKDCRTHLTPEAFIGKIFSVEVKKNDRFVGAKSFLIKDGYCSEDGFYRLSGIDNRGESQCTKLSPADAQRLYHEGTTHYWNGKTQKLYIRALLNQGEMPIRK